MGQAAHSEEQQDPEKTADLKNLVEQVQWAQLNPECLHQLDFVDPEGLACTHSLHLLHNQLPREL